MNRIGLLGRGRRCGTQYLATWSFFPFALRGFCVHIYGRHSPVPLTTVTEEPISGRTVVQIRISVSDIYKERLSREEPDFTCLVLSRIPAARAFTAELWIIGHTA